MDDTQLITAVAAEVQTPDRDPAVVSAAAQVGTGVAAAIWLPRLIERDASHYGVVGVAVALVSWLVVIAFVTVAGAVAGAWASRILDERSGRAQGGALPPDPGTH